MDLHPLRQLAGLARKEVERLFLHHFVEVYGGLDESRVEDITLAVAFLSTKLEQAVDLAALSAGVKQDQLKMMEERAVEVLQGTVEYQQKKLDEVTEANKVYEKRFNQFKARAMKEISFLRTKFVEQQPDVAIDDDAMLTIEDFDQTDYCRDVAGAVTAAMKARMASERVRLQGEMRELAGRLKTELLKARIQLEEDKLELQAVFKKAQKRAPARVKNKPDPLKPLDALQWDLEDVNMFYEIEGDNAGALPSKEQLAGVQRWCGDYSGGLALSTYASSEKRLADFKDGKIQPRPRPSDLHKSKEGFLVSSGATAGGFEYSIDSTELPSQQQGRSLGPFATEEFSAGISKMMPSLGEDAALDASLMRGGIEDEVAEFVHTPRLPERAMPFGTQVGDFGIGGVEQLPEVVEARRQAAALRARPNQPASHHQHRPPAATEPSSARYQRESRRQPQRPHRGPKSPDTRVSPRQRPRRPVEHGWVKPSVHPRRAKQLFDGYMPIRDPKYSKGVPPAIVTASDPDASEDEDLSESMRTDAASSPGHGRKGWYSPATSEATSIDPSVLDLESTVFATISVNPKKLSRIRMVPEPRGHLGLPPSGMRDMPLVPAGGGQKRPR
mmetsp:Transcript_110903/g.254164  ORF Transcript_110903/g.254164 Transcript_110903/m.254164 type:complete len:614 (+) Transcript_110903:43-1884(+)